jgi:ATP-dependent DNA helicase RecG
MKIGLKVIIQDATVEDLNQAALQKHVSGILNTPTSDHWNDVDFLNKSKLTIKGKITRTTFAFRERGIGTLFRLFCQD